MKNNIKKKTTKDSADKVIPVSQYRIDTHAGFPGLEIPELSEEEERQLAEDAANQTWVLEELENPSMTEDEGNSLFADD